MTDPGRHYDLTEKDKEYAEVIRDALAVCLSYKPKLGGAQKRGYTLEEFVELYGADPFYTWFGLNSPLVYAAHKAAGGMTSVYRQIGIACEWLFQRILQDTLGLTAEQSRWSYKVPTTRGKERTLALDARIPMREIKENAKAQAVRAWIEQASVFLKLNKTVRRHLQGPVFEVRQGYKSKDSKRQNADIANAANAYANHYLPVVVLFSSQIDFDVADRYLRAQWLLLRGSLVGTSLDSTYAFTREVLGYDLAAFFERTSPVIKKQLEDIVKGLLQ